MASIDSEIIGSSTSASTLTVTNTEHNAEIATGSEVSLAPALSKNAQKKAAKAAKFAEHKLERRAKEKEAKKRKRRERAELERERGENGGPGHNGVDREEGGENAQADDRRRRKRRMLEPASRKTFNAKVIVDLGFDNMMNEKEIVSLTSQLAYTYSANRQSLNPFSCLIFTTLNGRTKERLDGMNEAGYRRWSETKWWEEGYERLWFCGCEGSSAAAENDTQMDKDWTGGEIRFLRGSVVYLTADSDNELVELKEDEAYIIGGICDHNRYKNLCLNKANDSGIRHAKLPIGRYMSLATRKILTVNQVFEILLKWVETRDWEKAFRQVIPQRKFQNASQKNGKHANGNIVLTEAGD